MQQSNCSNVKGPGRASVEGETPKRHAIDCACGPFDLLSCGPFDLLSCSCVSFVFFFGHCASGVTPAGHLASKGMQTRLDKGMQQ